MTFKRKDVLGLEDMSAEEILLVLDIASRFRAVFDRPVRSVPIMRGRTVVNFFHEASTPCIRTLDSDLILAKSLL